MQRILVLGGGVGGTLVANLLVRKLKSEIDRGDASVTVVDETGEHIYQPGYMYIAMGNEKPERLKRPERSLLDRRVQLEIGRAVRRSTWRSARSRWRAGRSSTTTSSSWLPGHGSCPRRSSTSTRRLTTSTGPMRRSGCATRSTPSPAAGS